MNPIKTIFHKKKSRAWAITTLSVLTVGITVNCLALYPDFESVINLVLGGSRARYGEGGNAYVKDVNNKQEAFENSNKVNIEVSKEGMVLLKNEKKALPLKEGAKISVFGKNSVNLSRGGSGSSGGDSTDNKDLYDSLKAAGFECNPTLKAFYEDDNQSGPKRDNNPGDLDSGKSVTLATAETPQSKYTESVKSSYADYKDAAFVVITRISGEGFDLPNEMAYSSDHHYLELDPDEQDLLSAVCSANFDHVIVLFNTPSSFECGFLTDTSDPNYHEEIDAAMFIGMTGGQGIMALGDLLNGKVSPSGHISDTYVKHMEEDPTFPNFANGHQVDGDRYFKDGTGTLRYFSDYEEGIYVGYRYYETRGETDGEDWYNAHVCYPFGYGLSYTSFEWKLASTPSDTLDPTKKETVEVEVTNTGDKAGQDVVELYVKVPYYKGGIEKASKVLAGFAKTKVLEKGEKETLSIEVNPYYFASYDYNDANKNGFKGYELEKGDYQFVLGTDAHHDVLTYHENLASDYQYEKDPVTGTTVTNQFEDVDDHLQSVLSRNNWEGTWPQATREEDRTLTAEVEKALKSTKTTNPLESAADTQMPTLGVDNGIELRDLAGLDYDDPKWDKLLEELSASQLKDLFTPSAFHTTELLNIGKPKSNETDGPQGFTPSVMKDPAFYGTAWISSEVIFANTWDVNAYEKISEAIGNEGLIGNEKGDSSPYSGWYAPGLNIHRSPFGGRCAEYYSEDPLLSGKMASALIKGTKSKGVYTFMKHFAGNEQETHRSINGSSSWMTEQALREIYLRGFEIAVKEGKATGVMSGFNRLGTTWVGGDYALLTTVLRDEWGFRGAVISDFNTNSYMNAHQMLLAGGDLDLASQPHDKRLDLNNANDVTALLKAAHNTLYMMANSNLVGKEVLGYDLPIWQIVMYTVDGVAVVALGVWGFFALRSAFKKEEDTAEVKTEKKQN